MRVKGERRGEGREVVCEGRGRRPKKGGKDVRHLCVKRKVGKESCV